MKGINPSKAFLCSRRIRPEQLCFRFFDDAFDFILPGIDDGVVRFEVRGQSDHHSNTSFDVKVIDPNTQGIQGRRRYSSLQYVPQTISAGSIDFGGSGKVPSCQTIYRVCHFVNDFIGIYFFPKLKSFFFCAHVALKIKRGPPSR